MPLGHGRHRKPLQSNRSSTDKAGHSDSSDNKTVANSDQETVLTHLISTLRPEAKYVHSALPTFILELHSVPELNADLMAQPEAAFATGDRVSVAASFSGASIC